MSNIIYVDHNNYTLIINTLTNKIEDILYNDDENMINIDCDELFKNINLK